jgi:protein-S-isoprenylcysteine O-methyltransferase Ste14
MIAMVRHLLAILVLPFVVVVLLPAWLLTAAGDTRWGVAWAWLPAAAGIVVFAAGFTLFAWCVVLFGRVGQGTLAPWDPTRSLVAVGPYRYVRNPMISGVALMLMGEALFWGSARVALLTGVFVLINHFYFVFSEEPGLEARFGEPYRMYKANVPRWLPRLKPRSDVARD